MKKVFYFILTCVIIVAWAWLVHASAGWFKNDKKPASPVIVSTKVSATSPTTLTETKSATITQRDSPPVPRPPLRHSQPVQPQTLLTPTTLVYEPPKQLPVATSAVSIPVLLYHGEGDALGDIPTAVFADQMAALKHDGWQTISIEQFNAFMKGMLKLPDKSFLLTFDDGRKDTFEGADPVLKEDSFTAVMFVITGFSLPNNGNLSHSNFYLSKPELQTMISSGRWELESHGNMDHKGYQVPILATSTSPSLTATTTTGHFVSNKFLASGKNRIESDQEFTQRITDDLTLAKNLLEEDFKKPIIAYAYPYNDFGQDTVNFKESINILNQIVPSIYQLSFYQTWPSNGDTFNYPDSNLYMIKRIEPNSKWSGKDLLAYLYDGRPKDLPYSDTSFGPEWGHAWGTISISPTGSLILQADPQSTGAQAILNGTSLWKDYTFKANVTWISGSDVVLLARYQNAYNYLTCTFTSSGISLGEHVDSQKITLATSQLSFDSKNKSGLQLGIDAHGDEAGCLVNGKTVVSASSTSPLLSNGGIGIEDWDTQKGVAKLEVKSVNVY